MQCCPILGITLCPASAQSGRGSAPGGAARAHLWSTARGPQAQGTAPSACGMMARGTHPGVCHDPPLLHGTLLHVSPSARSKRGLTPCRAKPNEQDMMGDSESSTLPDPSWRGADIGGEVGSTQPARSRQTQGQRGFGPWLPPPTSPSPQATPATEEGAGPALAPSSPLPPPRTCSVGKGPHGCLCADKGGNVNTLPAPASQLSEVASASRANSSPSVSHVNCGALLP